MIPEPLIDFSSEEIDPDVITDLQEIPAHGVDWMEKNGKFFFVVNASPTSGEQLAESFGHKTTVLCDAKNWHADTTEHYIDVLHRTSGPPRVVFFNLGEFHENHCWHLEQLVKNEKVKSFWFVHHADKLIPKNIMAKVIMNCVEVDAPTLLDSIAFGWKEFGTRNVEGGEPTPVPPEQQPSEDPFLG